MCITHIYKKGTVVLISLLFERLLRCLLCV
jgi:hypothetical protein